MYETLLNEAKNQDVQVFEEFMAGEIRGLYSNNIIWLNNKIKNGNEKTCILAEELGHHYTSSGDVLDQGSASNRKQELRARSWAYERLVPLDCIVEALENGIENKFELTEYLGVTEDFLEGVLRRYRNKYGLYTTVNDYTIYFDPLRVES